MAIDPMAVNQAPQTMPAQNPMFVGPTALQLKNMYDYAKALQGNQQSVRHPLQGVSNIVNALLGGHERAMADQLQTKAIDAGAAAEAKTIPDPLNPTGRIDAPSAKKSASSGGALNYDPTGGSDDLDPLIEKAARVTKQQESGGDYQNVTTTKNRKTGRLQSAIGAYGIMDVNVPEWTQKYLGKKMTPQEFKIDNAAQDAVYRARMGEYIQKYGVEGAGRAWLGGEKGMKNLKATDPLGTTVGGYGKKFVQGMGGEIGTPAATAPTSTPILDSRATQTPVKAGAAGPMAFDGSPSGPTGGPEGADAVAAVNALAGGKAPVGGPAMAFDGKPAPADTPAPAAGGNPQRGIFLRPGQIPVVPRVSRWQLEQGLRVLPPDRQAALMEAYTKQFQPIEVKVPGGTVKINPNNPQDQEYFADLHKVRKKFGDVELEGFRTVHPWANTFHDVESDEDAGPPQAKVGAVPSGKGIPYAPVDSASPFAPTDTPAFPPAGAPPAIPSPGAQGAVPPAFPLAAAATVGAGPALAATPPVTPATNVVQAAPPGPWSNSPALGTPQARAAEKPPLQILPFDNPPGLARPKGVSNSEWNTIKTFDQKKIDQLSAEESTKKSADNYAKRFDTMMKGVEKNQSEVVPQLRQALHQLDNPDFYSGIGQDAVLGMKKLQAGLAQLFPNAGFNKYAGQSMQVFSKDIAAAILANMPVALAGLGQVRVAEIDLLNKAMASPMNTIEANRTLLHMALRIQERNSGFAEMAQEYVAGGEVKNPFSAAHEVIIPANPNGRARGNLDVNFDRMLLKNFGPNAPKENQPFTPEEEANMRGVWERDKNAPKAGKAGKAEPTNITSEGKTPAQVQEEINAAKAKGAPIIFDGTLMRQEKK